MSELICNAPFCTNLRNCNHSYCGVHRWEREKYKVKAFKQIPLFKINTPKIKPKYCPVKQKHYNTKYDSKRKNWRLKKRYGITLEEFNSILESQNHSCAICKTPTGEFSKQLGKERNLAVDHCHNTGKVRGILCYRCNMGLGYFNDNPMSLEQAINYLIIKRSE